MVAAALLMLVVGGAIGWFGAGNLDDDVAEATPLAETVAPEVQKAEYTVPVSQASR